MQYIWFVAKESNDGWVAVSEFGVANAPAKDVTVYIEAQEGGRAESSSGTLQQGGEATVTAEAEKGYTFAGWYDAVTDTKVSDDAEYTFAVTENTALVAKFTKDEDLEVTHTVTLIAGDTKTTQIAKDGESAAEPETPTNPGHEFLGWFEVGNKVAFDFEQPITGDVTLTARFEAYTVTPVTDAKDKISISSLFHPNFAIRFSAAAKHRSEAQMSSVATYRFSIPTVSIKTSASSRLKKSKS